MNSLEKLLDAIFRRIRITKLVYDLGKREFEINGETYTLGSSDFDGLFIDIPEARISLNMSAAGLRGIARNLRVFLKVSEKCKEYLEEELKKFEEEKELFSIFKLQSAIKEKKKDES